MCFRRQISPGHYWLWPSGGNTTQTDIISFIDGYVGRDFHYPRGNLYDEVYTGGFWVIVCLDGAGVWSLVIDVHVLDFNAVRALGVGYENHTGVYGPLVIAGV